MDETAASVLNLREAAVGYCGGEQKTDGKTNFPGTPVNVSRIRQRYVLRIRNTVTGCDHTLNFLFLTMGSVKIGHLGDVGC